MRSPRPFRAICFGRFRPYFKRILWKSAKACEWAKKYHPQHEGVKIIIKSSSFFVDPVRSLGKQPHSADVSTSSEEPEKKGIQSAWSMKGNHTCRWFHLLAEVFQILHLRERKILGNSFGWYAFTYTKICSNIPFYFFSDMKFRYSLARIRCQLFVRQDRTERGLTDPGGRNTTAEVAMEQGGGTGHEHLEGRKSTLVFTKQLLMNFLNSRADDMTTSFHNS